MLIFFFMDGSLGFLPLRLFTSPLYPSSLYLRTHWQSMPLLIPAKQATEQSEFPASTCDTKTSLSSEDHFLWCFKCFNASGPFLFSISDHVRTVLWKSRNTIWRFRPSSRSVKFYTFQLKLKTITHKITLLTGCPVRRVHINCWRYIIKFIFQSSHIDLKIHQSCLKLFDSHLFLLTQYW